MKNRKTTYAKATWLVLLVGVLGLGSVFTSCEKDEDVNGSEVMLFSYGPMPIQRGAELRFIGQNLDKVNSIELPDNITLSGTDFTEQTPSSIKLIVPQNAMEGLVKLNTADKVIETKTPLGFLEPITLEELTPKSIKAGEVLTLNGDYLNLVGEVIFTDRVAVDSSIFISQTRKQLTLKVPAEAQSGKIAVSNGAEDPIIVYSEEELTVTLPAVSSFAPELVKAGAELTLTGTDLDLVASIRFAGGTVVEAKDFVSAKSTEIVVATPSNIQDGTFTYITYSGLEIESETAATIMVPTSVSISAETRYKAGLNVTIEAENLDIATAVTFAGSSAITDFTVTDNKLTVAIPANATDGEVTLTAASGKTVATPSIELVKPVISELTPNPASAGGDFSITGTDLDLVISLTFGGGVSLEVTPDSETTISTKVPVDATSGAVVLNLENGVGIESDELTVNTPEFCFIPVLPNPEEVEIKAGGVIVAEVVKGDVLTEVVIAGTSTQYIVQGNMLHMLIPENAGGLTDFQLISSTGEITYQIDVIAAGFIETVVFTGPLSITWSDGGRAMVPISAFDDVPAGSIMKIYYSEIKDVWGQAQINNGAWAPIPFAELGNDGYIKTGMFDPSQTEIELELTPEILENIRSNSDGTNAIIIQGSDFIIAKISLIVSTKKETTIMEERRDLGAWAGEGDGGAFRLYKPDLSTLKEGDILKFYFEPSSGFAQMQLNHANWGQLDLVQFADATQSVYEYVVSADFVSSMMNENDGWSETGLIIQGENLVITKVATVN